MSTTLLYSVLNIRNCKYKSYKLVNNTHTFTAEFKKSAIRCSHCKSKNIIKKGVVKRTFRTTPIGNKQTFLTVNVQRVSCRDCKKIRLIKLGFAASKKRYTHGFAKYALQLLDAMTISDVAKILGVGWDLIKEIQKLYLKKNSGNQNCDI